MKTDCDAVPADGEATRIGGLGQQLWRPTPFAVGTPWPAGSTLLTPLGGRGSDPKAL
jgi:hypothetical protein